MIKFLNLLEVIVTDDIRRNRFYNKTYIEYHVKPSEVLASEGFALYHKRCRHVVIENYAASLFARKA